MEKKVTNLYGVREQQMRIVEKFEECLPEK